MKLGWFTIMYLHSPYTSFAFYFLYFTMTIWTYYDFRKTPGGCDHCRMWRRTIAKGRQGSALL